jgi:hypothetical protein
MNWVDFLASVGVGDESVEVTARGSATSMGPNGWNPNPPEMGCGQLSYAGLSCSYVGHKKGSHPKCEGALNYTCEGYAQSFNLRPQFGHLSGGGSSWIW